MSLSSHQRQHRGATDVWLTPPDIIAALGPFDLDPCAAVGQPWRTAAKQYTVEDNGLAQPWVGFVWCNPPFGPDAEKWLRRLADHDNGIGLVPARTETRWYVSTAWERADAVLFLHGRPHFHHADGTRGKANSGAPISLLAYGSLAVNRLRHSGLRGSLVTEWAYVPASGEGPRPWPGWCQACGAKMFPGSGTWCRRCETYDADAPAVSGD